MQGWRDLDGDGGGGGEGEGEGGEGGEGCEETDGEWERHCQPLTSPSTHTHAHTHTHPHTPTHTTTFPTSPSHMILRPHQTRKKTTPHEYESQWESSLFDGRIIKGHSSFN